MSENGQKPQGQLLLLLGVDGSGKTTILQQLQNSGYVGIEPSLSEEAVEFKKTYHGQSPTPELVNQREAMFLKLNHEAGQMVSEHLEAGQNVVITGHELVTLTTHETMRNVIDATHKPALEVERWLEKAAVRPNQAVILHAPIEVIEDRLCERAASNPIEAMVGYNSLTFIDAYQKATLSLQPELTRLGIPCLTYDTSVMSPTAIMEQLSRGQSDH